jgi:hypothetical protein
MRDCLRLRTRKEATSIITPACSSDPAMKVSDARVGPASARESSVLVAEEKQPELRLREQGLEGMPYRGLLPLQ